MAGNTGVQLLGKGFLLLVSIATFSLLTRYLGPELYGRYSLILAVFGMTAVLAELGVGTIAIRELAAKRESAERILPAVLVLRVGLGALALAASALIGWSLGYDRRLVELIVLYCLIFLVRGIGPGGFGLLSAAALQARKNVLGDAAEAFFFCALVGLGVANRFGIGWFVAAAVAAAVANSAVIFLLTRGDAPRLWRVDWRYVAGLLREAVPLAAAGLFSVIYFRIDALMLSRLSGESAVGIYSGAYKFVESAALLSTVFLSTLFPVMSYLFAHDRAELAAQYRRALEWTASFACSLALALYAFADLLVPLLSGQAFAETIVVLRICSGAILLMFLNNVSAHLLFAARQQRYLLWVNIVAALAKVAASFVVIPRYGAAGAAATTVATEMLIAACLSAAVFRLHELPSPLAAMAKLAPWGAIALVLLAFGHLDLWQRLLVLTGWMGVLLLLGRPKPSQLAVLLQKGRGG